MWWVQTSGRLKNLPEALITCFWDVFFMYVRDVIALVALVPRTECQVLWLGILKVVFKSYLEQSSLTLVFMMCQRTCDTCGLIKATSVLLTTLVLDDSLLHYALSKNIFYLVKRVNIHPELVLPSVHGWWHSNSRSLSTLSSVRIIWSDFSQLFRNPIPLFSQNCSEIPQDEP